MKTLICIMLIGYWMFGPAPTQNDGQALKFEKNSKRTAVKNPSGVYHGADTVNQVAYLDAEGNIIK
jgi:hypothetical protein